MRYSATRPFSAKEALSLGLLTALLLVSPAILAQKTSTNFDPSFDFSHHKRYAWLGNHLMTRQHPDTNEVMDLKIVKGVNQILTSRGFVEVKDNPDFYIYYDGGGDMYAAASGSNKADTGPQTPANPAPNYGLGNGPSMAPSTWLKVNGQIVFHVIDPNSKKMVWETTYSKTFHDPDKAIRNMDNVINQLVVKAFKDFPPKVKK
jgi:Domain of unknown function (DUF4136)